jgi:hypothetical protein
MGTSAMTLILLIRSVKTITAEVINSHEPAGNILVSQISSKLFYGKQLIKTRPASDGSRQVIFYKAWF